MKHLIKSGGGSGPVKPGSLQEMQGAKSGGETKDEACLMLSSAPDFRALFCFYDEVYEKRKEAAP